MVADSKRETFLPHKLWENKRNGDENERVGSRGILSERGTDKNHSTRFGIPIKPSRTSEALDRSKKQSTTQYHRFYNIDQAGPGVVALKDTENFPVCLIKERRTQKAGAFRGLHPVIHKSLVALVDTFQSQDQNKVYLIYNYEHLAISLGCAAGAVQFSEADIATICKEILEGLKHIHLELRVSHGSIDCSNIVLTCEGDVKIANIGDCLLEKRSFYDRHKDIKAVGSIVVSLSDRTTLLCESSRDADIPPLSEQANSFIERTKAATSVEQLLKDDFLHLANPGGAWCLKRHYFETLPMGIRIGSHVDEAGYES